MTSAESSEPTTSTGSGDSTGSHPAPAATAQLRADLVGFIAVDVAAGGEPVAADTDLVMSGLVDSLGVVMIVEWLEDRLDIEIDPGDVVIEHFASVDAIIDYLANRGDSAG